MSTLVLEGSSPLSSCRPEDTTPTRPDAFLCALAGRCSLHGHDEGSDALTPTQTCACAFLADVLAARLRLGRMTHQAMHQNDTALSQTTLPCNSFDTCATCKLSETIPVHVGHFVAEPSL